MKQLLEDMINKLTDMDWQWYPFLFLRPEKHEKMDTKFLFSMLIWYSPILVLLSVSMTFILPPIILFGLAPPISTMLMTLLYFVLFFAIAMRLLIFPAWNRRAKRFNKQKRKPTVAYQPHHSLVDTDAVPLTSDLANPTERTVPFISNRTD